MTPSEFSRLTISKKLQLLKREGDFVGTRTIPSYTISLFVFHGLYIELFLIKDLNQVQWIEIQNNNQILAEYTKDINLNDLLG